jgi:TIR domain-containing protein
LSTGDSVNLEHPSNVSNRPDDDGWHTFVCYAHEDSDFVWALTTDLKARGVPLWLDTDIAPGADWDRSLDQRLHTCANVLIVLSPAAVASAEVRGELRTALNLGKPIIPLLYQACEIPRQLQNIQYLDFSAEATDTRRDDLARLLQSRHHVEDREPHRRGQPVGRALRNRRDLLDEVKSEAAGRLAQSLHTGTLNVLKEQQPEQVTRRWDTDVKIPDQQPASLTPDVGIVHAFDDEAVAGRLLILGAPGSGKTTTLLELAQELINRAEADVAEPLPVLCNLSSWRDDGQALAGWLVDHLKVKYGVRKDNGNEWLSERLLVPLLDGLDEVAPEHQERCVQAINQFQEDYRPRQIVVCCRLAQYENYQTKLHLNGAIHLLPLTDDQIQQYLVHARCADLWQSIRADPESVELARSPLLLRIMTVAYGNTSAHDWQRLTSASERQAHLFDTYIKRLLSDDGTGRRYSKTQTVHWLTWLARRMKEHAQAEFLIEQLQPAWLESAAQRWLYRVGVVLNGTVAFVLAVLIAERLRDAVPNGAISIALVKLNTLWQGHDAVPITLVGLAAGITLATRSRIQPIETLVWSTTKAWHGMASGLRNIALAGLNVLAYVGLEIGLLAGLVLLRSLSANDRLSPELARWSTAGYITASVAVVALAVAVGLTASPRVWLVGGIDPRPRGSAGDAVLSGLAFALGVWPSMGLLFGASAGLSLGLIVGFSRGSNILSAGRFAKALVVGFTNGLGNGAITWWLVKPQISFVGWTGFWLSGGVGVAATTALCIGLAGRLKNRDGAVEVPVAGLVGRVRRWSACVLVGGIISVVSGSILAVVGRSAGALHLRGIALMTTRLGAGLVSALSFSLLCATMGAVLGLTMGALLGALFGVLRGLTGPDVERRTIPNQGIRQSAVNVGVFALMGGVIVGLPYGVLNVVAGVAVTRVAPGVFDWVNIGLGSAVLFGLLGGLVPGAACIQHFTLRFVLACFGLAPLRYARFLNFATERMLLQRVGGRYRFIHDLLRDYFAAISPQLAQEDNRSAITRSASYGEKST